MTDEIAPENTLTINCVVRGKSEDEMAYTGFMHDHQGRYLATVSGTLPGDWFKASPRRRPGRKKAEARHVSVAGHMQLAELIGMDEGVTLTDARVQIANLLNIGNKSHPENQISQIKDHCRKARDTLQDSQVMAFAGAADGTGRLVLFLEPGSRVEANGGADIVDGRGWIMRWGDRNASYGRIRGKVDRSYEIMRG